VDWRDGRIGLACCNQIHLSYPSAAREVTLDQYLAVLALAMMPAVGNFVGALAAEVAHVSQRTLSVALHLAAGVVVTIVGVKLMPEVLRARTPWALVVAFLAGGAFSIGVDAVIDWLQERLAPGTGTRGPSMIYFAVVVDLFSDGLMIGAAATISLGLGFLLALGQVSADLPEGFVPLAGFKRPVPSRARRLGISASFVVPALLGGNRRVLACAWRARGRKTGPPCFHRCCPHGDGHRRNDRPGPQKDQGYVSGGICFHRGFCPVHVAVCLPRLTRYIPHLLDQIFTISCLYHKREMVY
jgi:ZIP family zinc transporter